MLRTCTYLLVLFTFYSFYGGHNLSEAATTEPPEKQVTTTTTSGGFSASEIAGTSIGVISLLVGVFGLISAAIFSYLSQKKVLKANIVENNDGTLSCDVMFGGERLTDNVIYRWFPTDEPNERQTSELPQQKLVFDSDQKFRCEVEYTGTCSRIWNCCKSRKATSNTLDVKKKDLVAKIENSDDDSLICEVTLDNEPINVAYLTYKWYENEKEMPQETQKQLQQRQSMFMSKQNYKCVVVYKRGNISIKASDTLTVEKKNIIATIEECSDGKLKCNVKKDNERIEDGLTYQWYDGDKKLQGETGKRLAQNPVSFESVQKYSCEIKYTASNWDPDVIVKEASNTLKKRLIATIEENEEGSVKCEAKQDDESIHRDDLTYKWYESGKVISGETGQVLPQQRAIFEHNQKYSCAVVYTKGNRQINATSDSLELRKKYITATIDECDDGKLICNVEKDNKKINDVLTYQWYDGESELEGETEKKLTKEVSHDSKLRYRCEVKYSALATNVTVMASCIIATIDECDDGKFICNVEKGSERINDGLTYQWYDGERELEGEIGKQLAQNPVPHDSIQQYRCEVKFTAPTYVVNVTAIKSGTLEKNISATIDECDDGKLICNVEKTILTYQWYDGERRLEGETKKQVQNSVSFEPVQNYRCEVKYRASNWNPDVFVEKTSNTLTRFYYRAALQQSYRELKPCDMRYLCLEDIMQTFMELKYIVECDDEKPNLEQRTKSFEELKQIVFQNQSSTILITGDPGSGKTTSINRLAYESAVNPDLKGNILILVRLADLNDIDKDQCTLQTIIRKAIPLLDCTDKYADEPKHIETEITNNRCSGKYIFALDGYDEYKKSKEQNFITRLIKREVLKNCTVVISSRPSSCKDFSNDFKRFKIAQFDNIEKFIEHHYVDKVKRNSKCEDSAVREAEDKAEKLIEFVKKHEFLPSLCSLPLHCAMVCLYFDTDPPETLSTPPETITELYIFFVAITIKRHCETRNFEMPKQFDSGEEIHKQVKILKQVRINSEMLKPVCQVCRYAYNQVTGSDESIEFNEQSGLGLVTVQLTKPYDEKIYRFFHTTIMEYLAALHMVLSEKDWDLISKTKISEENLLEVWKFLCGLTKDMNIFKNIVSTRSTRNSYWIQCAHETQGKEALEHALSKFVDGDKFSCDCKLNPSDCAAIFQVLEPSQLKCLLLVCCHIGPEGARLLMDGVKTCSNLRQLNLRGNDIGNKGAEHISDAIKKLSTLTYLNLDWNKIGDEGAKHLSDAIKELPSLKFLNLLWNNIGKKAKVHLGKAKQSINVKRKEARRPPLTIDCGFQQLDD